MIGGGRLMIRKPGEFPSDRDPDGLPIACVGARRDRCAVPPSLESCVYGTSESVDIAGLDEHAHVF